MLAAPFVSGAAIMVLELVGLRLLAPQFGVSTYVWGGLLGTIMAALAIGYLAGGAVADRSPRPEWVFSFLIASAAWVVGVLVLTEPVLQMAGRLGASLGPVFATALLLGPPMLVLGSVSPFAVRLEGRSSALGLTAGRVFALATAGSLLGTYAGAFWLIPTVGCRQTLRAVVVTLVVVGVVGIAARRRRPAAAATALFAVAVPFLVADPPLRAGLVFAGESPYNTVYVDDQDGVRLLRLNSPTRGFHSVQLTGGLLTGAYYDILYLGPLLANGSDLLVLGMGSGTTVRAHRRFFPGSRITAVEIDPLVVRVAHAYMGLVDGPDLDLHVGDARPFLAAVDRSFDVIEVDVFAGGPYAPFYCLTQEFFAAARARLRPNGLLAMNVYAPDGDRTLAGAVAATLATSFGSVLEVPLADEEVLLAFATPTSVAEASARLGRAGLPAELALVAPRVATALRPAEPSGPVLADDLAPVEQLTHAMLTRRETRRRGSPQPTS